MERRTVELRVGGQKHRVITTGSEAELRRLVDVLEERLARLNRPGRTTTSDTMFLVALELVHELDKVREEARSAEDRRRESLRRLLARVDGVLGEVGGGAPQDPSLST